MGKRAPLREEGGFACVPVDPYLGPPRGSYLPRTGAYSKAAQVHCLALEPRDEWISTLVKGPRQRQRNPMMYADGGASSDLKYGRAEAERQLTPNPSTSLGGANLPSLQATSVRSVPCLKF